MRGRLRKWVGERGFGFIRPDSGTADVFVHISELKRAGIAEPSVGDVFDFDTTQDDRRRLQAVEITVVSRAPARDRVVTVGGEL